MYRMRRMEIAADTLYKGKFIKGFCHLYDGMEACGAGIEAVATRDDSLITHQRTHCYALLRGASMAHIFMEQWEGQPLAGGRGGSTHIYKAEANYFGGHVSMTSCNQTALGAGLAFAHKYKGDGSVAFVVYGVGATNKGQLFEALNMAALWKPARRLRVRKQSIRHNDVEGALFGEY